MLYFNPKPDFQKLGKYYSFEYPVELMEQYYSNGYEIVINWFDTDEKVQAISDGFKEIVDKFGLSKHFDNLFFLCLAKMNEVEAILDELYFQYSQRKRTKELAGLMLEFISNPMHRYNGVLLKTFNGTARVADKVLIDWIGQSLTNSINEGNMSATHFQYDIREAFFEETPTGKQLSEQKLKMEAARAVVSPKTKEKGLYADLCLYLYKYLVEETSIKPNANVLVSDAQLNFYSEILQLLGYTEERIDYDDKDYVRSLITNRLRKLNEKTGNKSK